MTQDAGEALPDVITKSICERTSDGLARAISLGRKRNIPKSAHIFYIKWPLRSDCHLRIILRSDWETSHYSRPGFLCSVFGAITDDDDSICGLNNYHNLNNSPPQTDASRCNTQTDSHSLTHPVRQPASQPARSSGFSPLFWPKGARLPAETKQKRECKSRSEMINGATTCYA